MKFTHDMVLFWGADEPFSNWYPAWLSLQGQRFRCAEQAFMYGKARLFGDSAVAARILAAVDPHQHKKLGRQVAGFHEAMWLAHREHLMYDACLAKFRQNVRLGELLMKTAGRELVEASPYDRVWGIGLAEDDPAALDHTSWCGLNLLGQVLMRVRATLRDDRVRAAQQSLFAVPGE